MTFTSILRLTLREVIAKKIAVGLFAVATLSWLLMTFALNLDIVDGSLAAVKLFGQDVAFTVPVEVVDEETGEQGFAPKPLVEAEDALQKLVFGIEAGVAGLTYWIGVLLALFATGGLVASMMTRGSVDLLLSKPISRTKILTARLTAVWLAAFVLGVYMLGMVWIVMSVKSGIWYFRFLVAIPVIFLMFVAMYGPVAFFSVATRNAALPLIVTFGLIFSSVVLAAREQLEPLIAVFWRPVYVAFYHILPNFAEVTVTVAQLAGPDAVTDWYPLISSTVFGAVLYIAAYVWFAKRDF